MTIGRLENIGSLLDVGTVGQYSISDLLPICLEIQIHLRVQVPFETLIKDQCASISQVLEKTWATLEYWIVCGDKEWCSCLVIGEPVLLESRKLPSLST